MLHIGNLTDYIKSDGAQSRQLQSKRKEHTQSRLMGRSKKCTSPHNY